MSDYWRDERGVDLFADAKQSLEDCALGLQTRAYPQPVLVLSDGTEVQVCHPYDTPTYPGPTRWWRVIPKNGPGYSVWEHMPLAAHKVPRESWFPQQRQPEPEDLRMTTDLEFMGISRSMQESLQGANPLIENPHFAPWWVRRAQVVPRGYAFLVVDDDLTKALHSVSGLVYSSVSFANAFQRSRMKFVEISGEDVDDFSWDEPTEQRIYLNHYDMLCVHGIYSPKHVRLLGKQLAARCRAKQRTIVTMTREAFANVRFDLSDYHVYSVFRELDSHVDLLGRRSITGVVHPNSQHQLYEVDYLQVGKVPQ